MKFTDRRIKELIMTDKGEGNLCLFCQKSTGSKNISVCENCVFDNNIFKSLGFLKELIYIENQK